jgi:hypothetical protein
MKLRAGETRWAAPGAEWSTGQSAGRGHRSQAGAEVPAGPARVSGRRPSATLPLLSPVSPPLPHPRRRRRRRRRRSRRAPEAGGDFLCPPPSARRAAVAACRWLGRPPAPKRQPRAEGRGRRLPGGRQAPGRGPSRPGVSGARPEGTATGGRGAWLPGSRRGLGHPCGRAGGKEERCGLRAPLTFCLAPCSCRRRQAPPAPAAVTRAQLTWWQLFASLAPMLQLLGKPVF